MSNQENRSDSAYKDSCDFIVKLGKAAYTYGSTPAQLESYLSRLTAAFGYMGSFRISSTAMLCAFRENEQQSQDLEMIEIPGAGLDLSKLALVGNLVDDIVAKNVTLADGKNRLDEIDKTPEPWGRVAMALGYIGLGAGLAVLFACSWLDVISAGVFSLIVFGMVTLSGRFGARTAEWLPLSSAFVVSALAALLKNIFPELNIVMVVLSSIAILLPGYTVSLGIFELVGRNVVSGMASLMSGLVYLVKQFAGAILGAALVALVLPYQDGATGTPVNSSWLFLFMPLIIIGLCVVFQTSKRDFLWASIGCGFAYGGILLGSAMSGGNLGNLLGTIVAVVYANLWAAKTRRPTSIVLLPAIILLVSGSIGFRGLAAMTAGQTAVGEQQFLQMFIVALTIAAGLLIGATIVRPKVTL